MGTEAKFHEAAKRVALLKAAPKMLIALRAMRLILCQQVPSNKDLLRLRVLIDMGLEGTEEL